MGSGSAARKMLTGSAPGRIQGMNCMKLRTGLLLGTAFLAGITAGPTLEALMAPSLGQMISSKAFAKEVAADPDNHSETLRLLTLFGTVLDLVRAEYVEPVSDKDLINNALDGMVGGLDPHSSYMNEKQFKEMQIQISGKFGGLGVQVQQQNGHIRVVSPIDGTPASRAGSSPVTTSPRSMASLSKG